MNEEEGEIEKYEGREEESKSDYDNVDDDDGVSPVRPMGIVVDVSPVSCFPSFLPSGSGGITSGSCPLVHTPPPLLSLP